MKNFRCVICKEFHEFSSVVRFGMPKEYLAKIYVEKLAYESDERWFIIDDEHYFVRGALTIPIVDHNEDFFWIVWVKVDEVGFFSFIDELSSADEIKNYIGRGSLHLDVEFLSGNFTSEVVYHLTSVKSFPSLDIVDGSNALSKVVEYGLSKENAIKIMSSVYH